MLSCKISVQHCQRTPCDSAVRTHTDQCCVCISSAGAGTSRLFHRSAMQPSEAFLTMPMHSFWITTVYSNPRSSYRTARQGHSQRVGLLRSASVLAECTQLQWGEVVSPRAESTVERTTGLGDGWYISYIVNE